MSRRKRIGIMGGTFDPVHMVHLTLAENAYHSFGLDEVLMLPNGDPPHKRTKSLHRQSTDWLCFSWRWKVSPIFGFLIWRSDGRGTVIPLSPWRS